MSLHRIRSLLPAAHIAATLLWIPACQEGEEEAPEDSPQACADEVDNDRDGAVDCLDPDCFGFCPEFEFTAWPPGQSPAEIGKVVAENLTGRSVGTGEMHYAQACTWYGALTLAALTQDTDLTSRLVTRFDPLLTAEGEGVIPTRAHVDDRIFGIIPLEIYLQTQDQTYLDMGIEFADVQWAMPDENGLTSEARFWIDDMYMITSLQVQAFRATRDPVYLDRAALTLHAYLDQLQEPTGLFFHTKRSRVYWGRGNGWVAAGLAELLSELDPGHPSHARILAGYHQMMEALLAHQTEEGLWRQIIDDEEAWIETSGSAMFAFAMATGVQHRWLESRLYGPAVQKAWIALTGYLDASGNLTDVCIGTGEAVNEVGISREAQRQYYLDRPRNKGDYHGQAPMLWTASALLRPRI